MAYTARAPEGDKVILDDTASGDYENAADKQSHGTEVAETSRSGVVFREGEPAPENRALLDVPAGRNSELA